MVCYARPASILAALAVVAYLVFGRPAGHFLDTAAIAVAVLAATGGAAVAAALVFATFMSARRRRAAAGGCVSCKFQCQHAMTGPVRTQVSAGPAHAPAPRWPDQPVYRAGGHVSRRVRERAGAAPTNP